MHIQPIEWKKELTPGCLEGGGVPLNDDHDNRTPFPFIRTAANKSTQNLNTLDLYARIYTGSPGAYQQVVTQASTLQTVMMNGLVAGLVPQKGDQNKPFSSALFAYSTVLSTVDFGPVLGPLSGPFHHHANQSISSGTWR